MNIEKLPSGSYRVRVMEDKKMYRFTFDHKPTQKEIFNALAEKINNNSVNGKMTFYAAGKKYAESKKNIISPNTYREYVRTCDRLPEWFTDLQIDEITQIDINKMVNELSLDKNPKTVRNYHGFISAVLGTFRPDMKIYTTLPQKRKYEPYTPSDEDVNRILKALEGTEFYIPVVLACYGMRRGEICALQVSDIENDVVHINKALAYTVDKEWVVKSTKTTESERDIIIPKKIADMIHKQGYVYNGYPNSITRKLEAVERELNIEHFSLHKLRHYFASKMLTITDSKTVQALGGWKTDNVMKNIYAHSMKTEQDKAKRKAVKVFNQALLK